MVVKIGTEFTGVDLVYRDGHNHVDTFSELMTAESRLAGVIMELGHPVSWLLTGNNAGVDLLITARVYRFEHRVLRNYLLGVDNDESEEQRKIYLYSLRAYRGSQAHIK